MVRLATARSASSSVTLITLPWQCLVTQECGRSKQYQISADNYTKLGVIAKPRLHGWDGMKANKANISELIPVFRSEKRMKRYEDGENLPTASSQQDAMQTHEGRTARSCSG